MFHGNLCYFILFGKNNKSFYAENMCHLQIKTEWAKKQKNVIRNAVGAVLIKLLSIKQAAKTFNVLQEIWSHILKLWRMKFNREIVFITHIWKIRSYMYTNISASTFSVLSPLISGQLGTYYFCLGSWIIKLWEYKTIAKKKIIKKITTEN